MPNYNLPESKRYKDSDAPVGHPNDRVPKRKAGGAPAGTKMHTERTERKPSGQMKRAAARKAATNRAKTSPSARLRARGS